jgi:hypothetical protein
MNDISIFAGFYVYLRVIGINALKNHSITKEINQ